MSTKPGNSLGKVLAILDMFTEDHLEWTPDELIEALGYSRPTLYRYLKTLKEAGFLVSLPNAGFTLGPRVVELDFLLRKSDALILNASPHLKELASRYSCTALLVRWYGDRILCVDSDCSTINPLSSYPRGRPMPVARGAVSRAIMASLPRRRLLPLIESIKDELHEVGLGSSTEEILASLMRIRKSGCAVTHGEVTPGVVGIAAPIFDAGQSPIASLGVAISGQLVNGSRIDEICAEIRTRAGTVSEALSRDRNNREMQKSHNTR